MGGGWVGVQGGVCWFAGMLDWRIDNGGLLRI